MEIALHRTYLYKFSIPQGERICTFLLPKEKKKLSASSPLENVQSKVSCYRKVG